MINFKAGRTTDPFFYKLKSSCESRYGQVYKITFIHYYEHISAYLVEFIKYADRPIGIYWSLSSEESYFDNLVKSEGSYVIYHDKTFSYALEEIEKWSLTPGLQKSIFYFEEIEEK